MPHTCFICHYDNVSYNLDVREFICDDCLHMLAVIADTTDKRNTLIELRGEN